MKKAVWSYFLQYIQNITYIFIHTPEYTQQGLEGYAAKAKSGYLLVGRVLSMFDLYVDFCSRQKTTLSCSHQSLYITYFNSLHRFSTTLYFYLWFACLLSTLPKFISLIHSCREGNGTPLQYSCLEKSHGRRSLVGCSPWSHEESDTTERLNFHFSLSCFGEGNGNPLQCPCLENPRDGEPGGLLSMGSHRVRHDWSDLAAAAVAAFTLVSSAFRICFSRIGLQ